MNVPWRAITIVSLAVNLLIVGAAVGFFMSRFPRGGPDFRGGPPMQERGLRSLPENERRDLARALTGAWESAGDLRRAARDAREGARAVVAKEPYDEAAVRKALADMRAADSAVLAHYQDALAASLSTLSAEQRALAFRAANRGGAIGGMGGGMGGRGMGMGRGDGRRGDGPPDGPDGPPREPPSNAPPR